MTAERIGASVRVLLIDDHPLFRRGMSQLLAMDPMYAVVGEASDGESGLQCAHQCQPDLVLLDLNMRGSLSGIDTLQRLLEAGVEARIVIVTVSDDTDDVVSAVRAGADGYLLKDTEPDELLAQLREGLLGQTVISPRLAGRLADAMRTEAVAAERRSVELTEREHDIVNALLQGKSNKLIARDLNIAEGTVKVHVKSLLKKLKLRSRLEVAVWAMENGYKPAG